MIALARKVKGQAMEGLSPDLPRLEPGAFAAATAWWRDAGVDLVYQDEPVCWLPAEPGEQKAQAPAQASPVEPALPVRPKIGGEVSALPDDLAAFQAWWMSEPSLDRGQVRDRVPPRGPARARLMILVGQPETDDREILLGGAQGRLLTAILAACDIPPEQVYVASALPRHTPLPDWAGLTRDGLGEIVRRHVLLAAPQRLLAFGSHLLPLLSTASAQSGAGSSHFYHEDGTIPLLGARELAAPARPGWKAGLWQQWLDWTGTEAA